MAPTQHRLATDTVLSGRYRVRGFLGKGGFASVYEAFDEVIEREVAIKVLRLPEDQDADARQKGLERFRREALTAARIEHPNIVTIFDMGVIDDQQPFIVMERLRGHDLERELELKGTMDAARLLPLFMRCLEALGEGHKQGIVHKDLKPSNMFLVQPGGELEDVRILDFGIARLGDENAALTGTGQVFGTARYFAPEYIEHQQVSPALDIYQMGLILVELLCGAPVVGDDNVLTCVLRHSRGELTVPDGLLSSPLGPIITRALERDPKARFEDARAFKKALEKVDPAQIPRFEGARPASRGLGDVSSSARAAVADPSGPQTAESVVATAVSPASARTEASPAPTAMTAPDPKPVTIRDIAPAPPTEPDEERKKPWALIVMAMALVGGVSVGLLVAFIALGNGDGPDPASDAGSAAVREAPEPESATPEPEAVAEPEASGEPEAKAPAVEAVTVELITDPPGASVRNGQKSLGTTPFTLTFEAGRTKPRRLIIVKAGYKFGAVNIGPGDAPEKRIKLTPNPRRANPATDVRPDPKPDPEPKPKLIPN